MKKILILLQLVAVSAAQAKDLGITYTNCIQDMTCEERKLIGRDQIEKVQASSTLKDKKNRYRVERLLDDKWETAWCEGKSGPGLGETVTITFKKEVNLGGFYFAPMFAKSFKTARQNNRIKKFTILAAGASSQVTVDRFEHDECGTPPHGCNELVKWQAVFFPGGLKVKTLTIRIDEVEKGSKYDDSCMSQLQFFPYEADRP
jgi:hypothetical protein